MTRMANMTPPAHGVLFIDGPAEGDVWTLGVWPPPPTAAYVVTGSDVAQFDSTPRAGRPVKILTYHLRIRLGKDGLSEWVYSIHPSAYTTQPDGGDPIDATRS